MKRILSLEHRRKLALSKMGDKNPSKKLDVRKKMSDAKKKNPTRYWLGKERLDMKGNKYGRGNTPWNKGKKFTAISGEKHHNWKGGIARRSLASMEYRQWRLAVFERDNYTCQFCGERGGNMEADHIRPWSVFPELRFEVSNGRTLCKTPCHREITKKLFKGNVYVG